MEARLPVIVRSTEIDVNGHLNNAKYLEYMEWGRKQWYDLIQMPFESFHAHGILTAIVNININYRKECRQNDELEVVTTPLSVGRTSYVFHQQIVNQQQIVCAEAKVTCVIMDLYTRKSAPVPAALRQYFLGEQEGKV